MANTFTAPFIQTQKTGSAIATAAVAYPNSDNPIGLVPLGSPAGLNGGLVTKITAMPRATVTASSLLLYIRRGASSTLELIDSALMPAYTLSATTAIPKTRFDNISPETPLRLMPGETLYVGSQVALAAGIQFRSEGGDY